MKYFLLALVFFGTLSFQTVFGQEDKLQLKKTEFEKVNNISSEIEKVYYLDSLQRYVLINDASAFKEVDKALEFLQTKSKDEKVIALASLFRASMINVNTYDFQKALEWTEISTKYFTKVNSLEYLIKTDIERAKILMNQSEMVKSKNILNTILNNKNKLEIIKKDKPRLFSMYRTLLIVYKRINKEDSSLLYLRKLEEVANQYKGNSLMKRNLLATFYDAKYYYYVQKYNYDSALVGLTQNEKIRIDMNDSINLSKIYHNFGNLYLAIQDYKNSIVYYQKSMVIRNKIKSRDIGYTYQGLSNVYAVTNNLEYAKRYIKKAIKAYQEINDAEGVAICNVIYANVIVRTEGRNSYKKAIDLYNESIEFFEKDSSFVYALEGYTNLFQTYIHVDSLKEAENIMKYLMANLEKIPSQEVKMKVYQANLMLLATLKGKGRDNIEIGSFVVKMLALQDSISFAKYDSEIPRKLAELEAERAKLDKKQQELENEALQKENEQKAQQNLYLWIGTGVLLLIVSLILYLYFKLNKAKNRNVELVKDLKSSNEQLEDYAKNLQTSNDELEKTTRELQNSKNKLQKSYTDLGFKNTLLTAAKQEAETQTQIAETANNKLEEALKISEEQKKEIEELKSDLEHQLRNDLLTIDQAAHFSLEDLATEEGKKSFIEAQIKLNSLGYGYHLILSENSGDINTKTLIYLCASVCKAYKMENIDIETITNVRYNKFTNTQKLYITILELIRNAVKHAFPSHIQNPTITLSIQEDSTHFIWIDYQDNGIGKPNQIRENAEGMKSFEESAVENTFVWENNTEGGTHIKFCLKKSMLKIGKVV